jgi:predicted ArsR family transcriptional regulator
MQRFNNTKTEEKIIDLLKETEIPCSIDFVAHNIGIAWGTARAILLNLVIDGRVQTQKTTKSLIFYLEKGAVKLEG